MSKTIVLIIAMLSAMIAVAQQKHDYAIMAQFGYETLLHKSTDFNSCGSDHGNTYDVSMDYYSSPNVALNGGVYAEHQGVFTGLSDGIGLRSNWLMGIHVGLKYYPLAGRGIVQPYIAGNVYLNFIGLRRTAGTEDLYSPVYDCKGQYHYVRQNAGASLSPQIGVELRVARALSVTLAYDFRLAAYGYNHNKYTFYGGKYFGKVLDYEKNVNRSVLSVGLKFFLSNPVK